MKDPDVLTAHTEAAGNALTVGCYFVLSVALWSAVLLGSIAAGLTLPKLVLVAFIATAFCIAVPVFFYGYCLDVGRAYIELKASALAKKSEGS